MNRPTWRQMAGATVLALATVMWSDADGAPAEGGDADRLSVGLQIGRFLNQGVAAQYLVSGNSAVNGNLGMALGTLTVAGDWVYYPTTDIAAASYRHAKGLWRPYVGAGAQAGWYGGLRALAGVQYGAGEAPLNGYFSIIYLPSSWDGSTVGGILGVRYQVGR